VVLAGPGWGRGGKVPAPPDKAGQPPGAARGAESGKMLSRVVGVRILWRPIRMVGR
jgi:hypothetical protein